MPSVGAAPVSRYLVIAYDDIFAIEYFERKLLPYWNRDREGPAAMLDAVLRDYEELERRITKAKTAKELEEIRQELADRRANAPAQPEASPATTISLDNPPRVEPPW